MEKQKQRQHLAAASTIIIIMAKLNSGAKVWRICKLQLIPQQMIAINQRNCISRAKRSRPNGRNSNCHSRWLSEIPSGRYEDELWVRARAIMRMARTVAQGMQYETCECRMGDPFPRTQTQAKNSLTSQLKGQEVADSRCSSTAIHLDGLPTLI